MTAREPAQEVEELLERLVLWVARRDDVRALALVGSWAYGAPREDSNVDVVLLTERPAAYTDREEWLDEVGATSPVRTADRGAITERRFVLASELEVELVVGSPRWTSLDPLDAGTHRVVSDGMRFLYDPYGLLAALAAACAAQPS